MDNAKYLILAEVGDSPYLVLAEEHPPMDGFVTFWDGATLLNGDIVKVSSVNVSDDPYAIYGILSALHPIFDAVKMYGCCYERKEGDAGETQHDH